MIPNDPSCRNPNPSDDQIIKALKLSGGGPVLAAIQLHCSAAALMRRIARSRRLKSELDAIRGELFETAVLKLRQNIMDGQSWAITLALKTDRGAESLGATIPAAVEIPPGNPAVPVTMQDVLSEVLNRDDFLEYCRSRGLDCHPCDVRPDGLSGEVAAGAPPDGDRSGDPRHDTGALRADSGDRSPAPSREVGTGEQVPAGVVPGNVPG
jgi:hypothetical protein